ncbi:MAG: DUF1289 domain-containing protein [Venatoribacter sp.]
MIDQGELFEIPSPCKRICQMNNKGYCIGCFRSRDERLYWNDFTNFQKQLVINLCEKRRLKVLEAKQQKLHGRIGKEEIQLDLFTPEQNELNLEPSDKPLGDQINLF